MLVVLCAGSSRAQIAASPGAFTRIGFGARGMAMGNSMSAVTIGELNGFYNPSVILFQRERLGSLSYGELSLDRGHNSLFYTQPIDSNAAVSIGILNSGVSRIDGRDNDGFRTEEYSTSENMFSLSFSLRIRKIIFGLSTKIFYYSLFKDVSSTTLGLDAGAVYPLSERITLGLVFRDINSKYKWETSKIYGTTGNSTTERFPMRKIIGISYSMPENAGLISAELENTISSTTIIRFGAEYTLIDQLSVRAGLDGWDLKNADRAHPSFGLTVRPGIETWKPSLTYSYIMEPYNVFAMHVISLSVNP